MELYHKNMNPFTDSPVSSVFFLPVPLEPLAASAAHGNYSYPAWSLFPGEDAHLPWESSQKEVPRPTKDLKAENSSVLHNTSDSSINILIMICSTLSTQSHDLWVTCKFICKVNHIFLPRRMLSLLWKKSVYVMQMSKWTNCAVCTCCFRLWAVVSAESIFGRVERRKRRL